jgi:hypothetical protein
MGAQTALADGAPLPRPRTHRDVHRPAPRRAVRAETLPLDLLHATVHVVEQMSELKQGELIVGPPKTDAGVRTVAIPHALIPELEAHLARWSGPGPNGLVFCGTKNQPIRRASLYNAWKRAVRAVGIGELRFHDLRHTGNTLAAATGASTRELMNRMGHASPRAALIYQHATEERDKAIADALSEQITCSTKRATAKVSRLSRASREV